MDIHRIFFLSFNPKCCIISDNDLGIFSKCPYKIQWHMKMPQYNHFICHFYCHFSVFSHILL